jgi:hypothetical protein
MHPVTRITLDTLEKTEWFTRIGVKDTNVATVVSSWRDAMAYCGSSEWEDLCLEARNQYCERLALRSRDRFAVWNQIVDELKKTTIPLVVRKTEAVIREHNLPRLFRATVEWDILAVCMESEYPDAVPPGFYAGLAYWYVNGHFPCGWQGQYPKGSLVIY